MNDSTQALIKKLKERDSQMSSEQNASDDAHVAFYMGRKEELFQALVQQYCVVRDGRLELKGILREIDLDKFCPHDYSFWQRLTNKAPSGYPGYRAQDVIQDDFLKYCQKNGLDVKGYWRSSKYSGGGF